MFKRLFFCQKQEVCCRVVCINIYHTKACGQPNVQIRTEAVCADSIAQEDYSILCVDNIVSNKFKGTYSRIGYF